mgnify:CR=1 FL=1
MAGDHEAERPDEVEGGPVKTFLEHLEDFRWMLIKSSVALLVAMLVCLTAGNVVVGIIKWPLSHARISYPGTNPVVTVNFGTNHLGRFVLSAEEQRHLNLGTNRFVTVQLEPLALGTNQVLGWRVVPGASAADAAHGFDVLLVALEPAWVEPLPAGQCHRRQQ